MERYQETYVNDFQIVFLLTYLHNASQISHRTSPTFLNKPKTVKEIKFTEFSLIFDPDI